MMYRNDLYVLAVIYSDCRQWWKLRMKCFLFMSIFALVFKNTSPIWSF